MKYLRVDREDMVRDDRIRELVWADRPIENVVGHWFLVPETHPNITALALILIDPIWTDYENVHARASIVSYI